MDVVVCLCACPDAVVAARIADALVESELAACVNVLPGMRSVYRWQGAVERADEVLLLIKTVRAQVEPVGALVASLHPYELPELLAVEAAAGLPAYLAWVADNAIPPTSRSGD
jgi:periplasmic divalent cation tolerance protein